MKKWWITIPQFFLKYLIISNSVGATMETNVIGGYDTTIRGNKWIASALSIVAPGVGHLFLAGYHDAKRNLNIGIPMITSFFAACISVITTDSSVPVCLYMIYAVIVICLARDAYLNGRNYRMWSGVVM